MAMATETMTIRVARETHELLAKQARKRGLSLSSMLAELAHEAECQAAFESEREASRTDANNAMTITEQQEWEATLDDGID